MRTRAQENVPGNITVEKAILLLIRVLATSWLAVSGVIFPPRGRGPPLALARVVVFRQLARVHFVRVHLSLRSRSRLLGRTRGLRWRNHVLLGSGIGHTCTSKIGLVDWHRPVMGVVVCAPRRALNARSTFQLLAWRIALITPASIEGNASFSVFNDCSLGLSGRGGFGGAAGGVSVAVCGFAAEVVDATPVSWGSSSKSMGLAVVGDSARGLLGTSTAEGLLGVDCRVSVSFRYGAAGRVGNLQSSLPPTC